MADLAYTLNEDGSRGWEPPAVGSGEPFDGGTIHDPLIIESATGNNVLVIAPESGGGGGKLISAKDAAGNEVFFLLQAGFAGVLDADGRGISLGHETEITPPLGATNESVFTVWDAAAVTPVFVVRADGSVHIKTGTSIIADL